MCCSEDRHDALNTRTLSTALGSPCFGNEVLVRVSTVLHGSTLCSSSRSYTVGPSSVLVSTIHQSLSTATAPAAAAL